MTACVPSRPTRSRFVFWLSVTAVYAALVGVLGLAIRARSEGAWAAACAGFLAVGWLQYVLIQAMHEACHQCRTGAANAVAALPLFWAIGLTRAYRGVHFAHHGAFNSGEDPDHPAYARFPRSRGEWLRTLLGHATGFSALRQLREQNLGETGGRHPAPPLDRVGMPLTQAGLLLAFTLAASPLDYVLFWLAPLVTVTKVLGYLRILAEHGDPEHAAAIRSFRCHPAVGSILGPYGFVHHAEHHAWANVPFSELSGYEGPGGRAAVDAYATRHGARVEIVNGSHFDVLTRWWRRLPNRVAG